MSITIQDSLEKLIAWIDKDNYSGWDIYDGLSILGNKKIVHNPLINFGFTQVFKWSPFNFRPLLGYKKITMPKAMGLFLHGYLALTEKHHNVPAHENYLGKARVIAKWLKENALNGFSGPCWNFGFNYKFMFDSPTVVITSVITKGLFEFYKQTGDNEIKELLFKIPPFVLKDLHITKTDPGICFSYTPIKPDCCYNATLFAAEILARAYTLNKCHEYKEKALATVDYVISKQHPDGRWNYSIGLKSHIERPQVDFHQGYILESLFEINKLLGKDPQIENSIIKGLDFYRNNQFKDDGRSFWRYPKFYPIDIHNQAQGIITFSLMKDYDFDYLPFAKTIAEWTINNMQDKSGYFYYKKRRSITNKIPYMRWSNAWMFSALATLNFYEK
jgi:hypothetical protein